MRRISNALIMAIVLSFLATGVVYAHCGQCALKGKEDSDWVQKKMERMTESLGLSAEQAKKIEALITEKVGKKKAIMDEYSEKIKAVLDDEQKVKYEEMRAEKKKGSHKHDHKGSGSDMKGSEKGS